MHTHPQFRRAGNQFRALGNERRLCIIKMLNTQPYLEHEISEALQIHQTAVAKHLSRLLAAEIVQGKRKGGSVEFTLTEDFREIKNLLEIIQNGIMK